MEVPTPGTTLLQTLDKIASLEKAALVETNQLEGLSPDRAAVRTVDVTLAPDIHSVFASVQTGLAAVEQRIKGRLALHSSPLTDISRYLLGLGGKRVRPAVALLSGNLFRLGPPNSALIDAAAGIELIHMATLLHDDIIDRAPTRRHRESAFRRFGLEPTLLAGDYLLVQAFGLCALLDRFVIEQTERACIELTEGEALEGTLSRERRCSIEEYTDIVAKKTASLFSLAAMVGAHLAGAGPRSVAQLRSFGYHAGITFQIIDDILDVTADEDLLGKPSGTDLRQKTPSLVNVLWLASGDPAASSFFAQSEVTPEAANEAAKSLRHSAIIEDCRRHAARHAAEARTALESLSSDQIDQTVRQRLNSIVDYTLQRCM